MGKKSHYRVIILGSGAAGLTAAIYAARASLEPTELTVDVEVWIIQIWGRVWRLVWWRCRLCRHSTLCALLR